MATAAVTQGKAVPGALYYGVTAPTGAAPYGGTALGLVAKIDMSEEERGGREITAHEFAGAPVGRIRGAEVWSVAFSLRGHDPDGFTAAFRDTFSSGAYRGRRPLLASAGVLATTTALLYAPSAYAGREDPGFLFYAAAPVGVPTAHRLASWPTELVWRVRFDAFPDPTSGRYVEIVRLAGMTAP